MKKLLLITGVLLISLLLIGFGYARWYETLSVSGTVNTGELDWEITQCFVQDTYAPPLQVPDLTCDPGFDNIRQLDKNVGWGECQLVDSDGDGDNDTLELTLHNVYPCYFNEIAFYPRNNGTIPLIIDSVTIGGEVFREHGAEKSLDLDGDGVDDIEIRWNDNFGLQLEPGENAPEISFWVHVLQGAPEGESLTFTITIDAVQWNEYVPPGT